MDGARELTPTHLQLREATREAHAAAEASPLMRRLLAGELDEAGYRGLLEAQLTLFRAWESERASWLSGIAIAPGWRYVSRAAALEVDLAAMASVDDSVPLDTAASLACRSAPGREGAGVNAGDWREEPSRPGALLQGVSQPSAAWGELYVIEGSALGGRMIIAGLRTRFPHLPHHFYGVGEGTPPWRRLQGLLDRVLNDRPSQEAATAAALAMFARFQRTLQDHSPHD